MMQVGHCERREGRKDWVGRAQTTVQFWQLQPGQWGIPKWTCSLGDSWVRQKWGITISPVMYSYQLEAAGRKPGLSTSMVLNPEVWYLEIVNSYAPWSRFSWRRSIWADIPMVSVWGQVWGQEVKLEFDHGLPELSLHKHYTLVWNLPWKGQRSQKSIQIFWY